jgi:hypothetical protein
MKRFGWATPLTVLGLVASLTLGFLVFWPEPAEATCFPWEYQTKEVFVRVEDCCDPQHDGRQHRYRQLRRYRTPSCDWGPWQNTNIYITKCVWFTCPIVA